MRKFRRIPEMLAADRRAKAAQRKAKRAKAAQRKARMYASWNAAKIDRRDPVAVDNHEAREVERYMGDRR